MFLAYIFVLLSLYPCCLLSLSLLLLGFFWGIFFDFFFVIVGLDFITVFVIDLGSLFYGLGA